MVPYLVSTVHRCPGVAFRFCSALQEEVCGDENRFWLSLDRDLAKGAGREMEVVTPVETDTEDLLAEVTSLVSGWCARRSGTQSAPRTTEHLVQEGEAPDAAG